MSKRARRRHGNGNPTTERRRRQRRLQVAEREKRALGKQLGMPLWVNARMLRVFKKLSLATKSFNEVTTKLHTLAAGVLGCYGIEIMEDGRLIEVRVFGPRRTHARATVVSLVRQSLSHVKLPDGTILEVR